MIFHNPFSSKKEPKTPQETIQVDNREKNSLVPSLLVEHNIQLKWEQLPIGDYIIKGIVIERKTWNDLQSSIINKRIFSQLTNLPKEQSLLIIEGTGEAILKPEALQGFLLSCALTFKIPYVLTKNEQETAHYLTRLALRKPSSLSLQPPKPKSFQEQQAFILQAFPGIGPKTADKLLAHFHTLQTIFEASEEQLLPFLGKKTKAFKQLLQNDS
ncbi:hypothetical protein FJZ22_03155 [Candidatus Pacearchaeota archaeon]|nr:hypothetical protein [Candidatus Pacearchaeota archaeon]